MIPGIQTTLIGVVVAGAVMFGVGLKMGTDGEAAKCGGRIAAAEKVIRDAASKLLDEQILLRQKSDIEATFAKGEVAKVNAQIALQLEEQKALLMADQAARQEAATKADQAATAAARESRATAAKFQAALEAIKHDPDECARAPLSPDVERMLDDLLSGSTP